MKVIIPAGGYATRLYPLTVDKPKALLPVGNKLMIEHIVYEVSKLRRTDNIIIVSNDKFFSQFEEWNKNFKSEIPITILNNGTNADDEKLGPIGEIEFAIDKLTIRDDLLVLASDNLFDLNLREFLTFAYVKNSSVIAVYDMKNPEKVREKLGVVKIDEKGKIYGFEEKPKNPTSALAATMIYYIKKEDTYLITPFITFNEKAKGDINAGDFWVHLLDMDKDPHAMAFEGCWYDIGSHEELKKVNEIYR